MFQLLHWNGSLKAMRERQCSRQEVTTSNTRLMLMAGCRRMEDAAAAAMAKQSGTGAVESKLIASVRRAYAYTTDESRCTTSL